jgi:hypothetical protein
MGSCHGRQATEYWLRGEYVVRYNLSTELGRFVCNLFRKEISEIHKDMSKPTNNIDTKHVQDLETWEYTARQFLHEWRFDTVFAANRFGQILQYIQSDRKSPIA